MRVWAGGGDGGRISCWYFKSFSSTHREPRGTLTPSNDAVGPGSGARLLADTSSATGCVTSRKLLNLSELQFPFQKNEDTKTTSLVVEWIKS